MLIKLWYVPQFGLKQPVLLVQRAPEPAFSRSKKHREQHSGDRREIHSRDPIRGHLIHPDIEQKGNTPNNVKSAEIEDREQFDQTDFNDKRDHATTSALVFQRPADPGQISSTRSIDPTATITAITDLCQVFDDFRLMCRFPPGRSDPHPENQKRRPSPISIQAHHPSLYAIFRVRDEVRSAEFSFSGG